jgi:hypothetical protein
VPVARGSFRIDLRPADGPEPEGVQRFTFDKSFTGDATGTSGGTMLSAGNPAAGSAGYVVMERFDGMLHGRRGTFVLQHSGTMSGGEPGLTIVVTPGSATGELSGLTGTFTIGADHAYELDYALPE